MPEPFDLNDWDEEEEEEEDRGGPGFSSKAAPTPVQHLPPPMELGGMSSYSDIHGQQASTVAGRSVSPRLFTAAAGHPTVTQLRVWKIENGNPAGLGAIEAEASEEDFVRMFYPAMPKPGEGRAVFKLRPMDIDGGEMGVEATLVIGEHHRALAQTRARQAAPVFPVGGGYGGGGGIPSEVLGLMTRSIDQTRASLDEERMRSRELAHQMAQERVDLASGATSSLQMMSERMLESERSAREQALRTEQERNQQTSDSMAAFFSSQLEVMKAESAAKAEREDAQRETDRERYSREREEAEVRRERDREDAERRRQRDRDEAERGLLAMKEVAAERERQREREMAQKREDDDRRRKDEQLRYDRQRLEEKAETDRREAERKREHALKLRQLDIEAEQRREHDKAMALIQQAQLAATIASQKPAQGIKDIITEGAGLMKMIGVDPSEIMQRFLNPTPAEPDTNQWADLVGKTMATVGEVAKAKVQADAQQRVQESEPMQPVFIPIGGGPPQIMTPEMRAQWEQQELQRQQLQSVQQLDPAFVGPSAADAMPPGVVPLVTPPPAAAPPAPSAGGPLPGAETLGLQAQKKARTALRELVKKTGKAPRDDWDAIIAAAITGEPAIYHYVNAVTVHAALTETRAHPKLIEALIETLKASPLVPDDMNYGGPL